MYVSIPCSLTIYSKTQNCFTFSFHVVTLLTKAITKLMFVIKHMSMKNMPLMVGSCIKQTRYKTLRMTELNRILKNTITGIADD